MAGRPFLDGYSGQSLDELIALADTHRIDSLVLAMEAALEERAHREGHAALSPEERVVLAIEALEREVNNGGYHQFFFNSSRAYAADVVSALRAIGCPQNADLAARALKMLRIRGEVTEASVLQAVEAAGDELVDALDPLDSLHYEATEDIAGRLFAFAVANRSRIRLE